MLAIVAFPFLLKSHMEITPQVTQYLTHSIEKRPDFDLEVLAPLRQKQAQDAARTAEEAKAAQLAAQTTISVSTPLKTSHTGDGWEALRNCESGGNYATNTGNGYYGAYQYDLSTWANYGGYARPDLAPPAVQDAKAQETFAARGSSPWPVCGRSL